MQKNTLDGTLASILNGMYVDINKIIRGSPHTGRSNK